MSASGTLSRKIKRYYRRVDDPAYASSLTDGRDRLEAVRRDDPDLDRILTEAGIPRRPSIADVTGFFSGLTDEQKRRILANGEGQESDCEVPSEVWVLGNSEFEDRHSEAPLDSETSRVLTQRAAMAKTSKGLSIGDAFAAFEERKAELRTRVDEV
jgi:hypothetical protein